MLTNMVIFLNDEKRGSAMKHTKYKAVKMAVIAGVFCLLFTGCSRLSIYGVWKGVIEGFEMILSITENDVWVLSAHDGLLSDSGYFERNGNSGNLLNRIGDQLGSAEVLNGRSLRITLNEYSFAPGTYMMTRQ